MPDVYLRSIEPLIAIVLARVCGSATAIAALLGRFLPRLGPLVATQAAFLSKQGFSRLTNGCAWNAVSAFAEDRTTIFRGYRSLPVYRNRYEAPTSRW